MTEHLRHLDLGGEQTINLSVDGVAALIRALYCAEYRRMSPAAANYGDVRIPRWDGGQDPNTGRVYQPVWPKLARFLMTRNIEPATYIATQFSHRRGLTPPAPNTLMSQVALERWEAQARLELPILTGEWQRQHTALTMRITELRQTHPTATEQQILVTAIHDQHVVDVSMLFRYCAAVRHALPQVAARYAAAALNQYLMQRRQYDVVAGAEIPDVLRQEADAVLRSFTTGKDDARGS